jgi:4-amino-4-deoxy-L-arabinose transferase
MFDSYFSIPQQINIVIGFVVLFISIIHFEFFNNKKVSLFFLLTGTLLIKFFIILLDSNLHAWDEAFHGLVAKHLSENPLMPLLYKDPIFNHDYKNWWDAQIWLHKQPWFLWQMALFIKVFGASAFVVRLPSLIYVTAGVFFIYDLGKNIANARIGFYGALFYCMNNYMNEQLSGSMATDHNDIVFVVLVLASFWAFSKYIYTSKEKKYIILIGLFCGLAILTKWLVALIVFFCWFWYIVFENKQKLFKIKLYFDLLKGLCISLLISIPWQIYILFRFPLESRYEYAFNSKHMFEVVEGHSGDYYYYDGLSHQYGYLAPLFCLLGIISLYKYVPHKSIYYSLILSLFFVFGFFTFAQTKLHGFTLVVSFIIFLGFGAIAQKLFEFIKPDFSKVKTFLFIAIVASVEFISFNLESIQSHHTFWKLKDFPYLKSEVDFKKTCDYVNTNISDTSYVFFNCGFPNNINFMFETNFIGYARIPDINDIKKVEEKGYKIAIFNDGNLPIEMVTNEKFKIINFLQNR